jgi:2-oxoisovalerate dehydrogenase E2 component (dihydrolipoyl transacylase)
MGTHIIKMPDIGEGIAEVELVEWHVKPGDAVVEDQVLADVMTDKATVQVPSPVDGKVVSLGGAVGEVMAVGAELIRLEVEGDGNEHLHRGRRKEAPALGGGDAVMTAAPAEADAPAPRKAEAASAQAAAASAPPQDAQALAKPQTRPHTEGSQADGGSRAEPVRPAAPMAGVAAARPHGGKPLASPAVRKRAWDLGIELQFLPGTGQAGQITHADLDRFLERGSGASGGARVTGAAYAQRDDVQEVQVVGLRRKIAEKMQEAKRRIPHFSYVEEVDVTELEQLRSRLNAQWGTQRGRLTLLPFLARAMIIALRDFPHINARYDDDRGVVARYGAVHLGFAAQTDAGLMVPVVRHAEAMDLWACGAEITRLAEAVRTGRATRDELSGSTITLSSLGALGGVVSTPVINYPEVAIVGVNRIVERPVIINGAVVARKMMNLSSSFDHRVVDGMDAAQFIQRIRGCLECPAMLFVD